jgi:hypothetical protein
MIAFVTGGASDESLRQNLLDSDADLLRILEDLINVLVDNSVILLTDFPEAVQRKLMNRQKVRDKLRGSLSLLEFWLKNPTHRIYFF